MPKQPQFKALYQIGTGAQFLAVMEDGTLARLDSSPQTTNGQHRYVLKTLTLEDQREQSTPEGGKGPQFDRS